MNSITEIKKLENKINELLDSLKKDIIKNLNDFEYPEGVSKISKNTFIVKSSTLSNLRNWDSRQFNIEKQINLIKKDLENKNSLEDIKKTIKRYIKEEKIKDYPLNNILIEKLKNIEDNIDK